MPIALPQIVVWGAWLLAALAALWTAGALYFDGGGGGRRGLALAAAWLAAVAVALGAWPGVAWPAIAVACVAAGVFAWWLQLKPSHDRRWDPHYARMPRPQRTADLLVIENVRNSDFATDEAGVVRYENRRYPMSALRGADLAICFWGSPWMCHPIMVFDFGDDGALCFSIEVRYRQGQLYRFWASLYRQQEMIYLACDPRDALLKRTRSAIPQDCYLYELQLAPGTARELLDEYVDEAADLAQRPRWYHGLTANCTTSVYRQRQGKLKWDWRMLVNGRLDRALYARQLLDQRLPFARLKELSRINELANSAPKADFYGFLRRELARRLEHEVASGGIA